MTAVKCQLCTWQPSAVQLAKMDDIMARALTQPEKFENFADYVRIATWHWVNKRGDYAPNDLDADFWLRLWLAMPAPDRGQIEPWKAVADHERELNRVAEQKAQLLSSTTAVEFDVPATVLEQMHLLPSGNGYVWLEGEGPLPHLRKIDGYYEHRDARTNDLEAFGVRIAGGAL